GQKAKRTACRSLSCVVTRCMPSCFAALLRFRLSEVQRVPVRILEVGDEELCVVDDVATKDDAACLERRDGLADRLGPVEADRHRSDPPARVLPGGGMQANR